MSYQLSHYNPMLKLILILLLSLLYMPTHSLWLNIGLCCYCVGWLWLSHTDLKRLLFFYIPTLCVAMSFFGSALLFGTVQPTSGSVVTQYEQAFILATRVFVFVHLGCLFSLSTKPHDLLYSLRDQGHLPTSFVYGIFAAIHLVSQIKTQIRKNKVALQMKKRSSYLGSFKVISLILIKTLYWADAVSLAMTSKRFNPLYPRTQFYQKKVTKADWGLVVGIAGMVGLILVL